MEYELDEDISNEDDTIIINEKDGLPDIHPTQRDICDDLDFSSLSVTGFVQNNNKDGSVSINDEYLIDELPKSLIVTNIHESVFHNEHEKAEIEALFREIDSNVTFLWLKSFKRLRVNYLSAQSALVARLNLHDYRVNKSTINCYFAQQQVTPINTTLQIPAPYKQFLISPPSSPPANWKPRPENEPLINHDLIDAIASLDPDGSLHEIQPSSADGLLPRIILQTAEKIDIDSTSGF